MTDVINFEHAQAMKAMGFPLNTPVVEGVTSPSTDKQWSALLKANAAYEKALTRYIAKPTGLRFKHFYQEVWRFARVITAADEWIGTVNFETNPSARVIVHLVLRAQAIVNFWTEHVEAARERGNEVEINLAELPQLEG